MQLNLNLPPGTGAQHSLVSYSCPADGLKLCVPARMTKTQLAQPCLLLQLLTFNSPCIGC